MIFSKMPLLLLALPSISALASCPDFSGVYALSDKCFLQTSELSYREAHGVVQLPSDRAPAGTLRADQDDPTVRIVQEGCKVRLEYSTDVYGDGSWVVSDGAELAENGRTFSQGAGRRMVSFSDGKMIVQQSYQTSFDPTGRAIRWQNSFRFSPAVDGGLWVATESQGQGTGFSHQSFGECYLKPR